MSYRPNYRGGRGGRGRGRGGSGNGGGGRGGRGGEQRWWDPVWRAERLRQNAPKVSFIQSQLPSSTAYPFSFTEVTF